MANITSDNFESYLNSHTAAHGRTMYAIGQYPSVQAYYGIYDSKLTAHKTLCAAYGDFADFSTITLNTACAEIPNGMTVAVEENETIVEYQYKKTKPAAGYTGNDLEEKGKDYSAGDYGIQTIEEDGKINVNFGDSQDTFITDLFAGYGTSEETETPEASESGTVPYIGDLSSAAKHGSVTYGSFTGTDGNTYKGILLHTSEALASPTDDIGTYSGTVDGVAVTDRPIQRNTYCNDHTAIGNLNDATSIANIVISLNDRFLTSEWAWSVDDSYSNIISFKAPTE